MKIKVWYLKQKCKIMRKYYAFLPAFVTKQLTSAQCHNLFLHWQQCFCRCSSLLHLVSQAFLSYHCRNSILNQDHWENEFYIKLHSEPSHQMRQWTGSGDCQRCNIATQEIGLDLSWLCGLLLSVIPPNIDTKQRPGSSLTIGTRCLKYCQSWVLIRAWDVSYTRDGPESQPSANIHNLESHTLMASFRIS